MNKKYKDAQGKAIKWRNKRQGKRQMAIANLLRGAILHGIAAGSKGVIDRIMAVPAKTPEERVRKAASIAQAIINANMAMVKAFGDFSRTRSF